MDAECQPYRRCADVKYHGISSRKASLDAAHLPMHPSHGLVGLFGTSYHVLE